MKFGKKIQEIAADWAEQQYINYKGLKKIISALTQLESSNISIRAPELQKTNCGIEFFYRLERELEKVNSFYLQKESELKTRSVSLLAKKRLIPSSNKWLAQTASLALKNAFVQFQADLMRLQSLILKASSRLTQEFVQVNRTGFRKILKKFDKRAKANTKELYMSRQVDIQPCYNNAVLSSLAECAAVAIRELDCMCALIDSQSNSIANIRVEDLETLLSLAMQRNNPEELKIQLLALHDMTAKDSKVEDPSLLSRIFLKYAHEPTDECLKLLEATGLVDFNLQDDIDDRTCLHRATIRGDVKRVAWLISLGSNVSKTDMYGCKPLHYASIYGYTDILKLILEQYIQQTISIDLIDHDGNTSLVAAIMGNNIGCVEILIAHGASYEPISTHAAIPLCLATRMGLKDIVSILLARGANQLPTADGMFPLHLAAQRGHDDICNLLISRGGNIEEKDSFNMWTPLFFAAQDGRKSVVTTLISAGAIFNKPDQEGWTPLTYALYHGHKDVAELLIVVQRSSPPLRPIELIYRPAAPSNVFTEDWVEHPAISEMDLNLEDIPTLSLPPPMMPFRIYGHSYLDGKTQISITFTSSEADSITIFENRRPMSLKLMVTSLPDSFVPFSRILPLSKETEEITFLLEDWKQFSLIFEICPTFGTKFLGRAVVVMSQIENALNNNINGSHALESFISPLLDSNLNPIGQICFGISIITPFTHPLLSIGGNTATYWKSTEVISHAAKSTESARSLITASSLNKEYIELCIQFTKEGEVVVYPEWSLLSNGFDLCLASMTYPQAKAVYLSEFNINAPLISEDASSLDLARFIYQSFMTLTEAINAIPEGTGISLLLKYPTPQERRLLQLTNLPSANEFVDATLGIVYSSVSKPFIFASANQSLCTLLNRKQPNYGVFFYTNCGIISSGPSLKQSIKFAKSNHLLGIICDPTPLIQAPQLIDTIKEAGLMLVTSGLLNGVPANVVLQKANGVDAIIADRIFRYNSSL